MATASIAEHFFLESDERERLLRSIAKKTGIAYRIVAGTSRTDAQIVALERDAPYCQYHRRVLYKNVQLHDIHHTRGRGHAGDRPEHCIGLCRTCHFRVENALGQPANGTLIGLLLDITRECSNPESSRPSPSPRSTRGRDPRRGRSKSG